MKNKSAKRFSTLQKGFTLIELLVVIAVIGVLAAAILIAIDPIQQLARGRDSGKKTSISQIGNAISAYNTANSLILPQAGWDAAIVSSGDLKLIPASSTVPDCSNAGGGTSAAANADICYEANATDFVVYEHMESKSEWQKCADATGVTTWYVYSSAAGKAGTFCGNEAAVSAPGLAAASLK